MKRTANRWPQASFVAGILACALSVASCNFLHNGQTAFKASKREAMHATHFSVELEQQTALASFRNSQALDCEAQYFYDHQVIDRTPEGIASGESLSQGRPSSHEEFDTLFVGGRTYHKNTSSWEDPRSSNASPEWIPSGIPRDLAGECRAMKSGESLGYVTYDIILNEGHIEYLGKRWVNDHKCFEYEVTFPSSRILKATKICLGSRDDLPYRVAREDYTATYDYGPVARLPVPARTPPPATP